MSNVSDFCLSLFSFISALLLAVIFMGIQLMLLWNWIMPILFGLPTITFWQAIGLLAI